jgi:hypothetical protein
MGALTTIQGMRIEVKKAIRTALETLATAIDANAASAATSTSKIGTLETLRDTGGMMVYKGTGNALPASPKLGWVFKLNATSAALPAAPAGSADGDFILWTGTAWEILVNVA